MKIRFAGATIGAAIGLMLIAIASSIGRGSIGLGSIGLGSAPGTRR